MKLIRIYYKLLQHFGKQYWWPADTPFEVIVGAILTQNTSWNNVKKAIDILKSKNLLTPFSLNRVPFNYLENAVRSAGFYKQKARRLKDFTKHLKKYYNYNLEQLLAKPKLKLRKELLSLNGIGKETADSIALYAGGKQVFVIDAYTKRMCSRLGITDISDYETLRNFFESELPPNPKIYNEFHALIVTLAKNYCRVKPVCSGCPLRRGCKYMRGLKNRQNKIFQIKKTPAKKYRPKTKKRKK